MRLFVAIALAPSVVEALSEMQGDLAARGRSPEGRVTAKRGRMLGDDDETMRIHWEESATTKTAPFRRNPSGAGGPPTYQTEAAGAPQALSGMVKAGHDEKTSLHSSLRACNPKTPARGPRDFCHGLLEPHSSNLQWVRPESMHLTLKFLGEVSLLRLETIADRLGTIRRAAFKVSVSGVGFFPNMRAPRVFWAGVASKHLEPLAAAVEKQMIELDFSPERRKFTPHLTLARSRRGGHMNPGLVQASEQFRKHEFGQFTVDRFHLYESRLGPSGAVYEKLTDYRLLLT